MSNDERPTSISYGAVIAAALIATALLFGVEFAAMYLLSLSYGQAAVAVLFGWLAAFLAARIGEAVIDKAARR